MVAGSASRLSYTGAGRLWPVPPLLVSLILPELNIVGDPLRVLVLPDVTLAVGFGLGGEVAKLERLALLQVLDLQLLALLHELDLVGALFRVATGELLGFLPALGRLLGGERGIEPELHGVKEARKAGTLFRVPLLEGGFLLGQDCVEVRELLFGDAVKVILGLAQLLRVQFAELLLLC